MLVRTPCLVIIVTNFGSSALRYVVILMNLLFVVCWYDAVTICENFLLSLGSGLTLTLGKTLIVKCLFEKVKTQLQRDTTGVPSMFEHGISFIKDSPLNWLKISEFNGPFATTNNDRSYDGSQYIVDDDERHESMKKQFMALRAKVRSKEFRNFYDSDGSFAVPSKD